MKLMILFSPGFVFQNNLTLTVSWEVTIYIIQNKKAISLTFFYFSIAVILGTTGEL